MGVGLRYRLMASALAASKVLEKRYKNQEREREESSWYNMAVFVIICKNSNSIQSPHALLLDLIDFVALIKLYFFLKLLIKLYWLALFVDY